MIAGVLTATAVLLIGRPSNDHIAELESYHLTEDPRRIIVRANVGVGEEIQASATEDSARITVTVRARKTDVFTFGEIRPVVVDLRQPVGSRIVVDTASKRTLTRGSPYPPGP